MYKGTLFSRKSTNNKCTDATAECTAEYKGMVEVQLAALRSKYENDCLDAKQLQKVLNTGIANVYKWINQNPHVTQLGRRKVVPIMWVAYFLVTGKMK